MGTFTTRTHAGHARSGMKTALILTAFLLVPLAVAGNEPYDVSHFKDATGFNTQRKMVREADGSLDLAYVVPSNDTVGRTEVVIVHETTGGVRVELARPSAARGDVSRPTLALDGQGRLWAAWTERANGDREVFAARYDGARWVEQIQLSNGSGYAGFPSLATDGEGRLHVAWYGFDGHNYQTFYRRHDSNGWGPADQLSAGTLDANNPSVVVDRAGGVHVAWYKSDGTRYHAWYAYRPGGGTWDLPYKLSVGDGEAFNVALAIDHGGNVHAAWDELRADGPAILHATRRGEAKFGPPEVLASGDAGGEYPAIAAWGESVLIAWANANGTLVGTDLRGGARGLLGGNITARGPSLRGPSWWPASDRLEALDILYAAADERIEHAVIGATCSPFDAPRVCSSGGATSPPKWEMGTRAAPLPLVLAALALVCTAMLRRR